MNFKQKYDEDGFYVARSVFTLEFCEEIKDYLNALPAAINIPFSDVPWGWGDLYNEGPFSKITDDRLLNMFCEGILGKGHKFMTLMVNNKAPWIGSSVEWHQEVFNMKTYAPGCDPEKDWESFAQVYVALDDQALENGCLKVFPGSHRLGILPHVDIVADNFGHKRQVAYRELEGAYKKCGVSNVIMSTGDVLFFNHRLIHGSASNHSPYPRKSIVLRASSNPPVAKHDPDTFERETQHRRNFVIASLSARVKTLRDKNPYSDFIYDGDKDIKNEVE